MAKSKVATIEINRHDAVELLSLVGVTVSKKTTNDDLALKFTEEIAKEISSIDVDEEGVEEEVVELMDKVTEGMAKGGKVAIIEEAEEDDEEEKTPKKTMVNPKAKEEGPGRGRVKGDKKVGVIANIIRMLVEAGKKKKPITKQDIKDKLASSYPDRPAEGMAGTVNMQVPTGLKTEKNITVESNDKGYWITSTPDIERYLATGSMKERTPKPAKEEKTPPAKPAKDEKPAKTPPAKTPPAKPAKDEGKKKGK